jgi:hypothetical protein
MTTSSDPFAIVHNARPDRNRGDRSDGTADAGCGRRRVRQSQNLRWALLGALAGCAVAIAPAQAQTCPTEDPAINSAKSHTVFLYFPTTSDSSFLNYAAGVSPAAPFNVTDLSSSIGTTTELINAIKPIVVDDYCEFDVQIQTTTTNPSLLPSPPAKRVTVAIGSDSYSQGPGDWLWGESQLPDIGDANDLGYSRVWAGTYTQCEGGSGPMGTTPCSMTGALTGTNDTLAHWAEAIGGTAAHEAGHTYGLQHTDDDPPYDPTQAGPAPAPGEDPFNKHLMPAGYNLIGTDRTTYRRHFSDRGYGILASNVGLSIETMHNWDLINPNMQSANSLAIDFLSTLNSISIAWTYAGNQSPWINPTVTGPSGTAVFKGTTYNKFRITWSTGNPNWHNPSPAVVAGGVAFHIGATFTGVNFNQPEPIIIQDVTLLDASSQPLALHPRLPTYDAGTADASSGDIAVNFGAPADAPGLRLASAVIYQLPRLATIDALVDAGTPFSRDKRPIRAWSAAKCAGGPLRDGRRCVYAKLNQPPHVQMSYRVGQPNVVDCQQGLPVRPGGGNAPKDASGHHDNEESPICAGSQRDPFPSAVVYVIATFVDPSAKYFDPKKKKYVVGPVTSKLYYQFAGIRKLPTRNR